MHVIELWDYSVPDRVSGFLSVVKQRLTTGSKLRGKMFTTRHNAGLEIEFPRLINQRQMDYALGALYPEARPLSDVGRRTRHKGGISYF